MPDRFTTDEFLRLVEPWEEKERAIFDQRMATAFASPLKNFSEVEADVLRKLLDVLIPQDEGIDLTGFVDSTLDQPLGRGDRKPGMPDTPEVVKKGLQGLQEAAKALFTKAFLELGEDQISEMVPRMQEDKLPGAAWQEVPASYFFERVYSRALHGYFAHPKVWMRIGFMGASFPEGYAWIGRGQVAARHERNAGWERL